MPDLDQLLNTRGVSEDLGAHVTAASFNAQGEAAFALGDGTLRIRQGDDTLRLQVHEGAILCMAAAPGGQKFLTGGDDGVLAITDATGSGIFARFGTKWVEQLAVFAGKTPLIAAGVGRNAVLFNAAGEKLKELAHPSTVTGLAFDAKGKRIAASHYNGASLWFAASTSAMPTRLEWKGSHTGIALHPAGEALATAMQENALHGWTLPEHKHMRMAGYPAKTESFGFTRSGRWLATGGADAVVLWPFFGGGPMGKPPLELGAGDGIVKRIACHPEHEVVAAGFETGMVIMLDLVGNKVLPVCGPGRGAVTALAWNTAGTHLALGTASGFASVVGFSK